MRRLTAALALTLTLGLFITGCDTGPAGTSTQPESTPKAAHQGHGAKGPVNKTVTKKVQLLPPEPGDSDIQGQLTITDNGETIRVTGSAQGLDPNTNYISLFYGVGSTVTGPLACEAQVVPGHPGEVGNALPPDKMHVGGWKTTPAGTGNMRGLDWPTLFEGFPNGTGYSGPYNLKNTPVVMEDNTPGNAVPDYVPIENVGTISIRSLGVSAGPFVGFGPDAVKACGKVIPTGAKLFVARLEEIKGSGVLGEATVVKKADDLQVFVHAKGFAPEVVEHAQHLHENASCSDYGPPRVSLDDDIANDPGDATNANSGDSFPMSTSNGEGGKLPGKRVAT